MLQAPSLKAASEGWMSENQILLADRKKYFFLDIPFYRTSPHPRRRLSELRDKRATLTPHWYKRSGNPGCPRGIKFGRERVFVLKPPEALRRWLFCGESHDEERERVEAVMNFGGVV